MIHFWAKTTSKGRPGISVFDHMANVGYVAQYLALISPGLLQKFQVKATEAGALAALHDIWKITPGFQRKCEAWLIENGLTKIAKNSCWDTGMESDHGKVSHSIIQNFLIDNGLTRKTAEFVSTILGAHHGRLNRSNPRGYLPQKGISEKKSDINWDIERTANAQLIWDQFGGCNAGLTMTHNSPSLWWLAGLTTVADWIGSSELFFPTERQEANQDISSLAGKALKVIGFGQTQFASDLSFHDLFHDAEHPEILTRHCLA